MTDPVPAADAPVSRPDTASPSPSHNHEEEASLARMPDDGAPASREPDRDSLPAINQEEEASLARMPDQDTPAPNLEQAASPAIESAPSLPPAPPVAAIVPPAPLPVADTLSPLEQRIRRIEDALAHLLEQRTSETRVTTTPAPPAPPPPPPAMPTPPAPTAALFDMGKRLLGAASHAVMQAPVPSPAAAPPSSVGGRALWLLWDTWAEARAIVRMFVDPRYQLPWSARILPLSLVAAIITSYYWMPGTTIPVLGTWINKAVDLALAFVLFKWLGHEARRYRQTSPDLPPNLRL